MERAILREGWMCTRERLPTEIFLDSEDVSALVATEIAALIRACQREGRPCVLGLATGSTPMHVYRELVSMHREQGLSFASVVAFNLDEYWPMSPDALQSYHRFMREHLFDHVDIPPEAVHIPDGTVPLEQVPSHCREYERQIEEAGGIDLQILGLGRTGHIGFNERGSSRASATRLITLDRTTRVDAASEFFGEGNVPRQAITMGVATILKARRVVLMVFGENKSGMVRLVVEGPVSEQVPASYLQDHPHATAYLDYGAAAGLARVQCPWVLGPWRWDAVQVKKAACWLAQQVGKPLLKLTDEDYIEHSLQDLLASKWGPAQEVNLQVFYALQRTISGWPGGKPRSATVQYHMQQHKAVRDLGGKPGSLIPPLSASSTGTAVSKDYYAATGSTGGESDIPSSSEGAEIKAHRGQEAGGGSGTTSSTITPGGMLQLTRQYTDTGFEQEGGGTAAFPKRVLVLSPHPDDDVISMGGTLIRLLDQGHELHVGYQTSGSIAVWDEDALRFADFAVQFSAAMGLDTSRTGEVARRIEAALRAKRPGEVDSEEVQRVKALIRQCEARSAGRTCGADVANLHFLNLPFYETGKVVKAPLSQADIDLLVGLLDRIRPHQVYAAGDLSDPHGTHRTCLQAIFQALEVVQRRDWYTACSTKVLLYRGAWQEWEPWEVDMAVPLSPTELAQKVDAIWKHQSQKDRALFPGTDPREFWQRAQDRNRATAALYDRLGLVEYEGIEAFVHYDPSALSPSHLFKPPSAERRTARTVLKGGELRGTAEETACLPTQAVLFK